MSAPTSVLSQTLKSISLTKIREISKQRDKYEVRKSAVLAEAAEHPDDPHRRITKLLRGVNELHPGDREIVNIKHWVQQSRYDASVQSSMLESCEEMLRSKLEVQSRRLKLAHLYSSLLTEWMEPGATMSGEEQVPADDSASFEVVDRQKERLRELCDRFEEVVFSPLETDEVEIDLYLNELFPSDDSQRVLKQLRGRIEDSGESLIRTHNPFTPETLQWSINALLAEDLLSEAKQGILRDFLENDLILVEIADVLNMRFADFDSWVWDAGEQGIPVLPRQQLNGKYRIWMDEDVLQAIFVEFIGIRCCNFLSSHLKAFVQNSGGSNVWEWETGPRMTSLDETRRRYYLGSGGSLLQSINSERRTAYTDIFLLSQLPATPYALASYSNDGEIPDSVRKGWPNIKQRMLRTLASEVLIHRALHGEAAVIQSDLQWYATGLSHTTIFAVMRFFGIPERLINFYHKVLQAPLNMSHADGTTRGPRIRQRGVPMAHATEKFIGELVLFALDLVVNNKTGMLLYRLHDDLFLVGEPKRCAEAWETMSVFAKVMGLEFNMNKTGSVYLTDGNKPKDPKISSILPKGTVRIGHLMLNGESGQWLIDQKQVGEHVQQLKKQLGACGSILGWVQTWNSCIGRFFGHTFGEPGYCFGREHVDSILKTYQQLNSFLFDEATERGGSNPVQYLKTKIQERFGVSDIPDAFILLPEKLGGLGLRNPFIPLLVIRDALDGKSESPEKILRQKFEAERENYEIERKAFIELGSTNERLRRMRKVYLDGDDFKNARKVIEESLNPEDPDEFFSFEEYTRFREDTGSQLASGYITLTSNPNMQQPTTDKDVRDMLSSIDISRHDSSNKAVEARWALQMFRDELLSTVGDLRLVEDNFLPLGVMALMRQKTVRWNMVL